MNCEHVWPQSHLKNARAHDAITDLHHMFPSGFCTVHTLYALPPPFKKETGRCCKTFELPSFGGHFSPPHKY